MSGSQQEFRLLVLGAGVVGLSNAILCCMKWPKACVTVMADKFGEDTTSYGAGGIFRPTFSKLPGVPESLLRQWLKDSWIHFNNLAHSTEASLCGTKMVSGYQFYNNTPENVLEKDFIYHYRPLTQKEIRMFPGTELASRGFFATTLMTEGRLYLKYLMKKFEEMGGKYLKHKVHSMNELVGQYDLVFNCTGLGSQDLLGDHNLVPIRGQLLMVKAPWIKHSLLFGDEQLTFVYPGQDFCVVGCTRQVGDYNLKLQDKDRETIWKNACRLLPSLKRAEVVSEWVGLRPHREPLRVEKDAFSFGSQNLKVVHNYGHGAEGISLSWSTSVHAVKLAKEMLEGPTTENGATGTNSNQADANITSKL